MFYPPVNVKKVSEAITMLQGVVTKYGDIPMLGENVEQKGFEFCLVILSAEELAAEKATAAQLPNGVYVHEKQ